MIQILKKQLNCWTVERSSTARLILSLIPASCPFARTVRLGGWTIARIPPLCKINPLYDELMALRFRALCQIEASKKKLPPHDCDGRARQVVS